MPKPAEKKRFNWRLLLAILAGLMLFASTAYAARRVQSMLLANERFFLVPLTESGVPGVRVEGNRYASRDRILLAFAADLNRSIFSVPLAERRRRLLAIDWIEDASVLRVWPNQLIVKVKERRPVAFAKLPIGVSGQFRYLLIDVQGVLMSVPRERFDFPVLTGITEDQRDAERKTRVVSLQQVLHELGPSAAAMISEVNIASPLDVRISAKVGGRAVELWLGDRNYLARFQNFTGHFDEIARGTDEASVFDLRIDGQITTIR